MSQPPLTNQPNSVDVEFLLWGFFVGLIFGGLVALFAAPRSGSETRQQFRDKLEEAVTPVDPVADSLAEGKAAARRRRAELGLDGSR